MNYSIVKSIDFFISSTWNSLFFALDDKYVRQTIYPMIALKELVAERKETLNPQNFANHTFNYIGLENIESNNRLLVNFAPKKGIEIKSTSKIFRKGDILYGRLRPILNKAYLIDNSVCEGICSTEFFILLPKDNIINSDYLSEILTSSWVLNEVSKLVRGAALPRIQINDFLDIKIPVPPMEVQIKIRDLIVNQRKQWLEYRILAESFPELIKDSIYNLLSGAKELSVNTPNPKSKNNESWINPLPQ